MAQVDVDAGQREGLTSDERKEGRLASAGQAAVDGD